MFQQKAASALEVEGWLNDYDPCNIGIVTGHVSGLVVIDVDLPDADAVARDLGLPLPTLIATTGGGGRHYFYRSQEQVKSLSGLIPGVDVRGDGGFVVAAPSVHESGHLYRWTTKMRPRRLPDEVVAMLPSGSEPAVNGPGWYSELLAGVSEGVRTQAVTRLAGRYASLGLTELETAMLLSMWNEANEPPLRPSELQQTIRWVYKQHSARVAEQSITSAKEIVTMLGGSIARR